MTAAALSRVLPPRTVRIRLIESDEIGTVGVGEATVPHIRFFNARLGFDEADFMARTGATFKLGIEFRNWGKPGDAYIHPFGVFGEDLADVPFHHHWVRAWQAGRARSLQDYSCPSWRHGKAASPIPTRTLRRRCPPTPMHTSSTPDFMPRT
jgi:tryptophan halogenase